MFGRALIGLLFSFLYFGSGAAIPLIPSHINDANSSLFWGTYRPALYFGTKTRSASPLATGLLWSGAQSLQDYRDDQLRHSCEQHDKLKKYGWVKHDGRNYGKQEINDPISGVVMTTEFIKVPGGKNGGEWAVKIKGSPAAGVKEGKSISLMYYVAAEDSAVDLRIQSKSGGKKKGIEGDVYVKGKSKDLGDFTVAFQDGPNNKYHDNPENVGISSKHIPDYQKSHYYGVESTPENAWKMKEVVNNALSSFQRKALTEIYNSVQNKEGEAPQDVGLIPALPDTVAKKNQIIIIQKILKVPFEVDVIFVSASAHEESMKSLLMDPPSSSLLSPSFLRSSLDSAEASFDSKFEETFQLKSKGYDKKQIQFSQFCFSNLIGGIGYWHGTSIVISPSSSPSSPSSPQLMYSEPRGLYSAVPSRPFFPRGFLWDEGFHQLIISKWDQDISMEILTSWLNSMSGNGWIEREQILGDEARSKVPREFQPQNPQFANPPTILFPIIKLAQQIIKNKQHVHSGEESVLPTASHTTTLSKDFLSSLQLSKYEDFLKGIYERVEKYFEWFATTQRGETPNTFRWRGRTLNHSLTSGLDDYPREGEPTVNEHHVDLLSWMIFSSSSLSSLSKAIGKTSKKYDDYHAQWLAALDEFHWNENSKSYADLSTHIPEKNHLVHDGYVSLFPFLLGHIPPLSPKLGHVLDVIRDPKKIWSEYAYFGTHENYWRGAIWININYLVLSSLHNNYIHTAGPHQAKAKETYDKLRANIIDNIYKNYERTGYVWEQYHPSTGQGQRSHPFTGWSSLVLLIMAESY